MCYNESRKFKPLFEQEFQAWTNGPVCPALYYAHKGLFSVTSDSIKGNPDELTEDEKDSINVVLEDYGDMEPYALRELSHKEDPWKNARGGLPEGATCETVIPVDAMGLYYGSL